MKTKLNATETKVAVALIDMLSIAGKRTAIAFHPSSKRFIIRSLWDGQDEQGNLRGRDIIDFESRHNFIPLGIGKWLLAV